MIPLALLFFIIIGLLIVVFRLLQNFFDAYAAMHSAIYKPEELLETNHSINQYNQELNILMVRRYEDLENNFLLFQSSLKASPQNAEILILSLKIYLQSILKLLKNK